MRFMLTTLSIKSWCEFCLCDVDVDDDVDDDFTDDIDDDVNEMVMLMLCIMLIVRKMRIWRHYLCVYLYIVCLCVFCVCAPICIVDGTHSCTFANTRVT